MANETCNQPRQFDVEGKLRIADDGVTFRLIDYDPLGRLRRVGPDGRLAVHAGAQMMAEYEPGGALARRHVFAPGLDEPLVTYAGATRTWHVADERGSVVAATDAGGMVVTSWGYGPHGEPDSRGMAPSFGFTGALTLPQLGLTSMRARVYSHRLGRFLQPDPIGQAGGLNLYDYAGGDPVNGWDPWGLQADRFSGQVRVYQQNPPPQNSCGYTPCPDIVVTGPSRLGFLLNNMSVTGRIVGIDQRADGGDFSILLHVDPLPEFCPIALTPDGDTKGENPKPGSGGYKTDLPGSTLLEAGAVYTGLRRLAGDTSTQSFPYGPLRPDIISRSYPSGIQLRLGADTRYRIDIPAGVFDLSKPETIHFKGGKGNMCPTS